MQTITITTRANGQVEDHKIYQLKSGWEDVKLAEFVDYQTRIASLTRVRQLIATAAWLSDVPTEILNQDVSIAYGIVNACPWRNDLPAVESRVFLFTHVGVEYKYVGDLGALTAGQLEALLDYLADAGKEPATALPNLLAVLYKPVGVKQTAKSVDAAIEAFQTLPITTAWPALGFFLTTSAPSALRIQQFSDAHAKTSETLTEVTMMVNQRLADSATFWQRWRWSAARLWTRSAWNLLQTCSPWKTSVGVSNSPNTAKGQNP